MKKLLLVVIVLACLTIFKPEVHAEEVKDNTVLPPLHNLTTLNPDLANISLRGANIPSKKHNVWKADYSFSGGTSDDVLYSSYRLYGKGDTKSKYYVTVKNNNKNKKVHVMCKREKKTYLEFDVAAGGEVTKTFKDIYPSTEWYLRFSSKDSIISVSGTVK